MRHQRPSTSTLTPAGPVKPRTPVHVAADPVDVWGQDSFPASDPPANW